MNTRFPAMQLWACRMMERVAGASPKKFISLTQTEFFASCVSVIHISND